MRQNIRISLRNSQNFTQKQLTRLFYFDPNPDFYLLFQQKLYALRKQILSVSPYFVKAIQKNHRVQVLDQKFDRKAFQKILGLFYGIECEIEKQDQIMKFIEIIKFLELQELQQYIKQNLWQNFDEYQLFFLLEFSNKIKDQQLASRCEQQLINFQFQQMNFGRYELIKCSEQVFQNIIKLHQKLKLSGRIKGLKFQYLRSIIDQYNKANSTKVDILTALAPPPSAIILQDLDEEIQEQQTGKFRFRRLNTICSPTGHHVLSASTQANFFKTQKQNNIQEKENIVPGSFEFIQGSQQTSDQYTTENQQSKSCSIEKRVLTYQLRKIFKKNKKVMTMRLCNSELGETTSPTSESIEDQSFTSYAEKQNLKKELRFIRKKSEQISPSSYEVVTNSFGFQKIKQSEKGDKIKPDELKLFKSQVFKRKF